MGNRTVITDCSFRLDAEDPVEIQSLGDCCFGDAAYASEPHLFDQTVL